MHVTDINGVKVYNLTSGKILPEWLSQKRKKAMIKKDEELDKRIQLIQDFEMPAVTNSICITKDGNYILSTGMYKPRIRCYDVKQLSMKFERCVDAEIIKIHLLTDDYSKFICLEQDRWVEFHASYGFHFKTRIPKIGRDLDYDPISCEVYFVGNGSEIFRLNLQQGRFMNSLQTNARTITACQFNPSHRLFTCVTIDGTIECWDPRAKNRVSLIDCSLSNYKNNFYDHQMPHSDHKNITNFQNIPSGFSALRYKDGLKFGVGTNFGMILLYDLRCKTPYLTKDHMYGLPIKKLEFLSNSSSIFNYNNREMNEEFTNYENEYVASMDAKCLKIWDSTSNEYCEGREEGLNPKNLTCIEPGNGDVALNDVCFVPNSGMLFLALEEPQIASYFIPKLGPAPKWFSYLDALTEELEGERYHDSNLDDKSLQTRLVYDDYKFVTSDQLQKLGLSHLIGTQTLRAYMHGYFIEADLYFKTLAIMDPFSLNTFKSHKVDRVIAERVAQKERLKLGPREDIIGNGVNSELAQKLSRLLQSSKGGKENLSEQPKNKSTCTITDILTDERFKGIFSDSNFNIDPGSEEYKFINPIINRMEKKLALKNRRAQNDDREEVDESNDQNISLGEKDRVLSSSDDENYFFNSKSSPSSSEIDETEMNHKLSIQNRRKNLGNRKYPQNMGVKDSTETQNNANYVEMGYEFGISEEGFGSNKEIVIEKMDLHTRLETVKRNSSIVKAFTNENLNKEMTFKLTSHRKKSESKQTIQNLSRKKENRIRRPVRDIVQHKFKRKHL
ncbi:unnamed protein product [Gordionus sp. m RMFG-2023]|uniref:nucleolar protein 10-like n=1 Tax=Gordionus sp. m RMFG-2023 TaxID=3053472 RepID=UPI0030DE6636